MKKKLRTVPSVTQEKTIEQIASGMVASQFNQLHHEGMYGAKWDHSGAFPYVSFWNAGREKYWGKRLHAYLLDTDLMAYFKAAIVPYYVQFLNYEDGVEIERKANKRKGKQ